MRATFTILPAIAVLCSSLTAQLIVPSTTYPTIQSAIDAAAANASIQVLPGTYFENIDLKGKTVTLASVAGPTTTTIDGGSTGPVVSFTAGSPRACVLDGFTITHGVAKKPGTLPEVGGGIFINASSPTIRNCIVRDNRSNAYGGGIGGTDYPSGATSPLIESCVIENNFAQGLGYASGGGICLTGFNTTATASVAEIRNCLIRGNQATARGGGCYFGYNHSAKVDNCVLTANQTLTASGGLDGGAAIFFALNAICTITNNRIFLNSSFTNGGGIKYFNVTGATVVNNTICNNTGGSVAGYANTGAFGVNVSSNIVNCILWNNGATEVAFSGTDQMSQPPKANITYSDVAGGYAGTGNFNANPMLANQATDNLRLLAGSPCVNAGDNTAASLPATDFEGDPRVVAGTVDIGADERTANPVVLYADRGSITLSSPGTTTLTVEAGARAGATCTSCSRASRARPPASTSSARTCRSTSTR
jgi:hypothetical protein